MFQTKTFLPVVLVALVLGCAAGVHAGSISVANYSFENPIQANNTWSNYITSWNISAGGSAGAQNFVGNAYGDPPLPAPAAGIQAAYVNGGGIYQDVGKLLANVTYTLTVAAGNQPGYGPGCRWNHRVGQRND